MRKKLPKGRTLKYHIFKVCERFGLRVSDFYETLDRGAQSDYLAYEMIRNEEEINDMIYTASGKIP